MGNVFRYYMLLAKRWVWLLVLGAVICSSATYLISTFLRPIYQASVYLIVDIGTVAHPSITESLQAVPTFAQLLTTPAVLNPVVVRHPGMSVQDLSAMISVKPQANTQIIELDVQATSPRLAADLANQVSQSFAQYVNANSGGQEIVQIIPAQVPSLPTQPRPLEDAGIGGGVGFLLALMLVALYEWIGNRATSVEQIQELLGAEIMGMVPYFSRRTRRLGSQQVTTEKYHMISASLNLAQANRPFKLVMFTSALAGEGKSTIASNVARNLARAGKQVLLIDLNIHRPVLAQLFHLENHKLGLTDLLARQNDQMLLEPYSQTTEVPGLYVLTSGKHQMNSSELLQSLGTTQIFSRLRQTQFDYILFDAPPLFAVAETRILVSSIEALVLVVNGSYTPRKVLEQTRQILQRIQTTRLLGVIVNQSSWPDYTDAHPYKLSQPQQESELQLVIEQVTLDLPAVTTMLLPAPETRIEQVETRFPDTGENEQVGAEAPKYVIRPSLSLNGLTLPTNGLTRRVFQANSPSDNSQTLQNN